MSVEHRMTISESRQATKPRLHLPADVEFRQSHCESRSTRMPQVKLSASCSAHSSNSSAWTSSYEKTMGFSEGDDDDDLTWSPGSEPSRRRSSDLRSPIRTNSPGSGLVKRKTDIMPIASYENDKAEKACKSPLQGCDAGLEDYGREVRSEEKSRMDEDTATKEAGDAGFSTNLLVEGNRMSAEQSAKDAGAVLCLPKQIPEQGGITTLPTQKGGLTGSQTVNGLAVRLASSSKSNSHSRNGKNAHPEVYRQENSLGEERDVYSSPRLHEKLGSGLSEDTSEGGYHGILDFHSNTESDLYQPIELAEGTRWHDETDITDSSDCGTLCTIDSFRTHFPGRPHHAFSTDLPQLPSSYTYYGRDFQEDRRHIRKPQAPRNHILNESAVHELSPASLSVISPSCVQSGLHGSPVIPNDVSYHPCSGCCQHLNWQNHHQLLHLPSVQQEASCCCYVQSACLDASAPHQEQRLPPHRIQFSQRLTPPVPGSWCRDEEQEQLRFADVPPRTDETRKPHRHLPPFPSRGAVPYVLCQHCALLLQAPVCSLPIHGTILKLRCGSCLRVSKFGLQHSRKPQMAPRSFADGAGASREESFHFPAAARHISSLRLGVESHPASHEVSSFWSKDCDEDFYSSLHRHYVGLAQARAVSSAKTLPGNSSRAGDDANADVPRREIVSSAATLTGAGTHNRVNVTQWDALEASRVSGWTPLRQEAGFFSKDRQIPAKDVRESAAVGIPGTGIFVSTGLNPFADGTGVLSEDRGLSAEEVRKSGATSGFGVGSCVSPWIDSQARDDEVAQSSSHYSQRNDGEGDGRPSSIQCPGSPLYKLLGYKSPEDLRPLIKKNALVEILPRDCPPLDAYCAAGASDARIGSTAKQTFSPRTPDREEVSLRNPQRILEVHAGFAECPELKRQVSVDSAILSDKSYAGKSRSGVAPKTIAKSEIPAGKFSAGFFRRSLIGLAEKGVQFRGSSRQKVIVNGHVMTSAAILQAEERAGKLRPGCYWYDYKAGFWGVSGGPCVGIIPPVIREFHGSLSRDSSAGTTNILVNGRELRPEDLDKLARRGLSREASKSYSISFDGTVIDESSGETLKSLGKLAPTVERRGKGCGMFMAPSRKILAGSK